MTIVNLIRWRCYLQPPLPWLRFVAPLWRTLAAPPPPSLISFSALLLFPTTRGVHLATCPPESAAVVEPRYDNRQSQSMAMLSPASTSMVATRGTLVRLATRGPFMLRGSFAALLLLLDSRRLCAALLIAVTSAMPRSFLDDRHVAAACLVLLISMVATRDILHRTS